MLVAGGFLGDFLKGPVPEHLPPALARGVRLHRRVDAYSNANAAIRRSCGRFPASLRRLAPALVDVLADHVLAGRWAHYHGAPLEEFSQLTYTQIAASEPHLGADGRRFFSWMQDTNLLKSYETWESTSRGMRSVTRRLKRQELNTEIERTVPALLPALAEDFEEYFPEVLAHAHEWLSAARRSS